MVVSTAAVAVMVMCAFGFGGVLAYELVNEYNWDYDWSYNWEGNLTEEDRPLMHSWDYSRNYSPDSE